MNKVPVLSFFTGGGFLDIGFDMAGFEICFSNELDKDFAQFYHEGMSSWAGKEKKITQVCSIDDIPMSELQRKSNSGFGIIGGPPCQDFSIRGSKNGFDGIRGTMTYHFYEKIMDLQPDFFLMENVPGLVMLSKTKKAFNEILDLFRDTYHISLKRLNSLHLGVPQNRERLFVFGIKKNLVTENALFIYGNEWFRWPEPKFEKAEVRFDWGEPSGHGLRLKTKKLPSPPEELCVESLLIDDLEATNIPNANEFFKIYNQKKVQKIEEGDTYRPSFKRLHRKKYSPTVCYGNNEVHLHPFLNRRLSVREALRIQGVPDSYVLTTPEKLSKKFKMIGNGVPIPLAYQIAKAIMNFLNGLQESKTMMDGYLVKGKAQQSNV